MENTRINFSNATERKPLSFEVNKSAELACLILLQALFAISLFIGNLSFMQPLHLIFLLTMPGYLLIRGLNLRQSSTVKLFLSICFSILFCYFTGLASDVIGILLKLRHPLSQDSLLVSTTLVYLGLTLWQHIKTKRHPLKVKLPISTSYSIIIIALTLISFLFCVFGAILLNNGGSSVPMFASYVLAAVIAFLVAMKKLPTSSRIYIPILWILAITLLLSYAARANYLSGVDINAEYHLAHFIQAHGYWSINLYRNAYNACLSIGLLPVVLSNLTHINVATLLKIAMPLIFSSIVLAIYEISRKFLHDKKKAFYAALFFIIQPAFFTTSLLPVRQEMALLFFAGAMLVTFSFEHSLLRKVLFLVMNAGMILSHYSTAYMALGLYILVFIVSKILGLTRRPKLQVLKLDLFNGRMIILLFMMTFLWYSQITTGFSNIITFVTKSFDSIPNLLDESNQASGQSLTQQLNPFSTSKAAETQYNDYIKSLKTSKDSITPQRSGIPNVTPPRISQSVIDRASLLRGFVKDLGKVLVALGGIILIARLVKRKDYNNQNVLALSAIILLGIIVALPFISINYDYNRAYQQLLIVIAPLFVLAFSLVKKIKDPSILIAIFSAFYLLLLSYAYSVPLGGADTGITFSNNGSNYDADYTHKSDVIAANWLVSNTTSRTPVYADSYANYKINLANNSAPNESVNTDLFDYASKPYDYVYTDFANNKYGLSMFTYNGNLLVFKMPNSDLSADKNLVYSNGYSKIYGRSGISAPAKQN